jgi:hypothetical protein
MAIGSHKGPIGKSAEARVKFRHTTGMSCKKCPARGDSRKELVDMVINTNMAAITSANNLDNSTNELNNALAQLLVWLQNCESFR